MNNKLTVLALSHIGPEQNFTSDPTGAKKDIRYYNDAVFTYKINDDWTSVTELNYFHDDFGYGPGLGGAANSYSAVQYFSYAFTKDYTLNLRGEVYRDANNFTVATPTDNSGIAKGEIGSPPGPALISPTLGGTPGQGTTYASGTLGITFKPDVPKPLILLAIRPEVRYDRIVSGAALYGASGGPTATTRNQFTVRRGPHCRLLTRDIDPDIDPKTKGRRASVRPFSDLIATSCRPDRSGRQRRSTMRPHDAMQLSSVCGAYRCTAKLGGYL
jgi:hypothetical protein